MVAVCVCGALSGQDKPPGRDRLPDSWHPPWSQIVRLPALWHFNFVGPDAERFGRRPRAHLPRPLLERVRRRPVEDRRSDPSPLRRESTPGRRDGIPRFAQSSRSARKDEADNLKAMETKLAMPVLAIGAAKAFGANVAVVHAQRRRRTCRNSFVPNAGHWLMEEAPAGDDRRGAGVPRSVKREDRRADQEQRPS